MQITNRSVRALRGEKNRMDAHTPYYFLHESERQANGKVKKVNTIFLTNSECPFSCVMCDLWKNTLDIPTPAGAIPRQIEKALASLPEADIIKLYNSGNFFDRRAIPKSDYADIANLISEYERVIVENHPKLTGPDVGEFRDLLNGRLEIAMGIETLHPEVLKKLNKSFTPEEVISTAAYLTALDVDMRAFLLLNPPFLVHETENETWILKSHNMLCDLGFSACTLIPTRTGNGMMEELEKKGHYRAPDLALLERVFEKLLTQNRGRVFADTWDLALFSHCDECFHARAARLERMNLTQVPEHPVSCMCNHNEKRGDDHVG